MSTFSQTVRSGMAPPEPDLTQEEMVARAVALRPRPGSHSIRFSGTRIPETWGFEGNMLDVEVANGTPGSRLHVLGGIAREVMLMCWKVIDEDLWQTVGASVARDGERTTRVFRDIAVAAAHRNLQLRDIFYGDIGRATLGEPQRVPGR